MESVKRHGSEAEVADFFSDVAQTYVGFYKGDGILAQYFNQRLAIVYRHLAHALEANKHPKLLDLGCGPGMLLDYLHQQGHASWEFWGIDIAEGMIQNCQDKFGQLDTAHFTVGQLQTLTFSNQHFDAVLCMGAIEYLTPPEVERAIAEMVRVLKPDGVLVLSVLSRHSLHGWKKEMRSTFKLWLSRIQGQPYQPNVADGRRFSERTVNRLLKHQALVDLDYEYFGVNPTFERLSQALPWLHRFHWRWPYNAMVVKATKPQASTSR